VGASEVSVWPPLVAYTRFYFRPLPSLQIDFDQRDPGSCALATLVTIQELGFLAPVTVFVWLELQKIDADVKKIS